MELKMSKRAPNGFIGMRGKKTNNDDDDGDDYSNPSTVDWSLDPLFHHADNDNDDDDDADFVERPRYKKTPIAFYGVRGKKLPNQYGNSRNYNNNFLNEVIQLAEEERLRERMLQDFLERLSLATAAENEINKRAPTGFTGLRGKRPAATWNELNEEIEVDGQEPGDTINKRAPVNAFVGVRGKKDVSKQQEAHQTIFKRSPSQSFGGKRRISDFNNKFVAVRGKKATAMDEVLNDVVEEENIRRVTMQRLRFLVALFPTLFENTQYAKRAPNGFIGMRGKRAADSAAVATTTTTTASPTPSAAKRFDTVSIMA